MRVELTDPQFQLVTSTAKAPAMVAGYGAGKSEALIVRALKLKLENWHQNVAFYEPTYDLVRLIAFPRFCDQLERWGVNYNLNRNDNEISFPGTHGKIIFRTMDRPERIVGFEVADSLVDELDTLKTDKAREVWNKIIGRNRQKKDGVNTVAVGTTPEGFRFVYDRWKRDPAPGYELIHASTWSNAANLPAGYIENLQHSYPSALLSAYLDGEFVNLTAGSVYPEFDRQANSTDATIEAGEPLHIGMDFNVANMAATINVMRDGQPMALNELTEIRDTPQIIEIIKQRFKGHHITVYPDQSGRSRKSVNASVSDLSLLSEAGFSVWEASSNPAVKDRVLAMNQQIEKRALLINPDTCAQLCMSLEQQAYDKNGEPDKASGFDHLNDAAGYFIHARYPVQSRRVQVSKLAGF